MRCAVQRCFSLSYMIAVGLATPAHNGACIPSVNKSAVSRDVSEEGQKHKSEFIYRTEMLTSRR